MFKRKLPKTQIAPTPIVKSKKRVNDILFLIENTNCPRMCYDCRYFTNCNLFGDGFCDIEKNKIPYHNSICNKFENNNGMEEILWCEDCKYFTRYDMGGEGFCDIDDSSTWYGRPVCEKFERKQ